MTSATTFFREMKFAFDAYSRFVGHRPVLAFVPFGPLRAVEIYGFTLTSGQADENEAFLPADNEIDADRLIEAHHLRGRHHSNLWLTHGGDPQFERGHRGLGHLWRLLADIRMI
jgi:hypothetical protein